MNHNFVLFAGDYDYNRILYKDIQNREDIRYNDGVGSPFSPLRILHKIHTSPKANRLLFDFPGKDRWYRRYWTGEFSDGKPVCFVFHASYLLTRYRFTDYLTFLRSSIPDVRLVLFYEDLIGTFDPSIHPDAIRDKFDLIFSYDKSEADTYGILYYPTSASGINVPSNPAIHPSDVYLLAFAKDRFPKYLTIYEYLTSNGVSCDFNVMGVPEKERVDNGIHYLARPISYMENLEHVCAAKCILDIRQRNSTGFTLRLWEAILYDKKILTDNDSIIGSEFFDPEYVSIVSGNKPDISFIKAGGTFVNPNKEKVSPERFFEHIDNLLSNER